MHLWCRLILLTTTTFNLLRPSGINPKLWTKELLDGAFNYNKIPLTPPGYKIILHDSPEKHGPWEPYGVDGWYFGAAPEHCTAFLCCEPCKDRIARTVEFFPHYFAMTNTSYADAAIFTTQNPIHAVQHPKPATTFTTIQSDQAEALPLFQKFSSLRTVPPRVHELLLPPTIPPMVQVTSPGPQFPALAPAARQQPSIIKPNDNYPICHRYHLQYRINVAKLLPA